MKNSKKNVLNILTGFADGEGCFSVILKKEPSYKIGWKVEVRFIIGLHKKDKSLLELIQSSLGVGNITKQGKDSIQYCVGSVKDLQVVIDHFDKYPLISQKRADYLLFKRVFELINREEHLTTKGLREIIAIKASMNLGLSEKRAFSRYFSSIKTSCCGSRNQGSEMTCWIY